MKKKYNFKKRMFHNSLFCFLLLAYNGSAQILNFTIDTAVDNGTNITETIIAGSDTYVLTIDHAQDVEELFDLGGGDLTFFLGSGNGPTPFMLSITKNNNPISFMLKGVDYDTIVAGNITITNQDNTTITTTTSYPVGSGPLVISNTGNATNITQFNIIPGNGLDLNNFVFHNISVDASEVLSTSNFSALEDNIEISPNPSNGNITIKNSGVTLDNVLILDLNGRLIVSYNLNGITEDKSLDLSSLVSSGMYFMSISSGGNTTVKKLIIK